MRLSNFEFINLCYLKGLNYIYDVDGNIHIQDSYFMSYQTTAIRSYDFYTSLKQARAIADDVVEMFKANGKDLVFFPYR